MDICLHLNVSISTLTYYSRPYPDRDRVLGFVFSIQSSVYGAIPVVKINGTSTKNVLRKLRPHYVYVAFIARTTNNLVSHLSIRECGSTL